MSSMSLLNSHFKPFGGPYWCPFSKAFMIVGHTNTATRRPVKLITKVLGRHSATQQESFVSLFISVFHVGIRNEYVFISVTKEPFVTAS